MSDLTHRFAYHQPSTEGVATLHGLIRQLHGQLAQEMDRVLPDGREKSLVFTKLEEAQFWANASVARNQHDPFADLEV